ncbi:hypothetical protein BSL78_17195 [Apostichopus japonicus]|uniref:Reverse transcriptase domain-containing protein n=1 Tax=Stichopus japonicus TaxID=307972 RepID=A0A2G8KD64_STIJA|nr:hypothetical protein BSL78_17195 [Apostichopus japonicus]
MADSVPKMDWNSSNQGESFKLFKQRLELYFQIKKITGADQVPILLLAVGEEGLQRYNSWTLTVEESICASTLFGKFMAQLEPAENFRIARLKLETTINNPGKVMILSTVASYFQKNVISRRRSGERLVEQIIASTPISEFQKELLSQPKEFTIQKALELGRRYEAAAAHITDIQAMQSKPTSQIATINKKGTRCRNCGGDHVKGNCPARNDQCRACGKMGHWAKLCLTTKFKKGGQSKSKSRQSHSRGAHRSRNNFDSHSNNQPRTNKHIESIQQLPDREDQIAKELESFSFSSIKVSSMHSSETRNQVHANIDIKLNNKPGVHSLNIKVDTGAEGNTLPMRIYRNMYPEHIDHTGKPTPGFLKETNCVLTAYNDEVIKCFGTTTLESRFQEEWLQTTFFVVDVTGPAILGLNSCRDLHLITLHCAITKEQSNINSIQDLKQAYPNQFDKIGEFQNEHKLVLDPNVPSHIDPPRKTPIALRGKIKQELDSMESQSIIRRIEEPTEWVSSLTYVTKRDGSLRVCLDPKHLNQALIRPIHKTPTLEELNHKFSGAKVFSKLDAKAGYWAVKLDTESQKLTTFQTPFGRYCFQRLPFGLTVSQDIFQLEMDRILERCNGACGIADDIVIFGKTDKEHDENLINFMEQAKKHGLALNSNKCVVKTNSISFFGNVYTSQGIHPDPAKVADIQSMTPPSNKTELQQFLGMMTYLSSFVKDFSSKTSTLRDLLKANTEFLWEAHHQSTFNQLKQEISASSLLLYYASEEPVYLQCDASLKGLGVALLQKNEDGFLQPVAYASKSLTKQSKGMPALKGNCFQLFLVVIVFTPTCWPRVSRDHRS